MTIDAMHWVWNHSSTKGNTRLVLLAIADKVTDAACTTRMGTSEFRVRLGNVTKSVVVRTVDKALDSGELVLVEEARGTRAAKYWLPLAANYTRPTTTARGSDLPPLDGGQGSQSATPSSEQGWQSATPTEDPRGSNLLPEGWQSATPRGSDLLPLHQATTPTRSASQLESQTQPRAAAVIPDFARPLVDAIQHAGYDTLRWNLKHPEWLIVHALIKNHGIERLARYAIEQCQQRQINYGKYFLSGWRDLPPAPNPSPNGIPQLSVVRTTPPAKGEDLFDRAMARAHARMQQENQ